MATWIAHLRVAENILINGYNFLPIPFTVGNIGPDSGVPNEDWSNFDPPKRITHWTGDNGKIDAGKFKDRYLSSDEVKKDIGRYSFLMGYYIHLLTDIEWSKLFDEKKKEPLYMKGLEKDPQFIWTIKKDWYGLDFLYLNKHPESIFNTLFSKIDHVPDYLDYFPRGAFERQVKYITGFYLGENEETKVNFIYLTEDEMDRFIYNSTAKINSILSSFK